MEGVSDWRLYSAEHSFGENVPLEFEEMQPFVDEVTSTAWWRELFGHTAPIKVQLGDTEHDERNLFRSAAHAERDLYTPQRWVISIHPRMLSKRVLIHELAHCASPHHWGDIHLVRRGAVAEWRYPSHGPLFAAALAAITERVVPEVLDSLVEAFTHFDVPVASIDELRDALEHERRLLDALDNRLRDWRERIAQMQADHETEHGAPSPARPAVDLPAVEWGRWLRRARRGPRRRLISQKTLACAVSQVLPCTPRHIAGIERSMDMPSDPTTLKRSMLAAIYLNVDPLLLEERIGLTRRDCGGITLEEAERMNPEWAALVARMAKQIEARPPHWEVSGAR